MIATILQPGFQTTVQDGGRMGWRALGISPGGACDVHAAQVANALVGNETGSAVLEVELGGLGLAVEEACLVAWTGGAFQVRIQGEPVPAGRIALLSPGEELSFGYARTGCRGWLAFSGGIQTPLVLGSRATDLRAGLGGVEGRVLVAGDRLPLGAPSPFALPWLAVSGRPRVSSWGASRIWAEPVSAQPILRVVRGAEWARLSVEARQRFLGEPFVVSPDLNRMGVRLSGPVLPLSDTRELLSEGVAPGTIQLPPGGQPILLLADSQTIGGYPKLAHIITVDLPVTAQLRPNDTIRFQEVSMAEAHRLFSIRTRDFARFRLGVSLQTP